MYSCVNQPRGCRGRCNSLGGRCESCRQLNLKRPSVFSGPKEYSAPKIDLSALQLTDLIDSAATLRWTEMRLRSKPFLTAFQHFSPFHPRTPQNWQWDETQLRNVDIQIAFSRLKSKTSRLDFSSHSFEQTDSTRLNSYLPNLETLPRIESQSPSPKTTVSKLLYHTITTLCARAILAVSYSLFPLKEFLWANHFVFPFYGF